MLDIEEFKKKLDKKSRLMGIDPGRKRVGIAISDENKIIATPYTTLIKNKYSELEKIIQNNDPYVIFTSPSSFDSFSNLYDPKKVKIVSIGNTTSSHISEKGFDTALTSGMQSFEGISESLIAFLKENKEYELSEN